ncbi:MAG: C45 family autoproteolytic acyltransferase/hydrolase [Eubacteriales bacterium]
MYHGRFKGSHYDAGYKYGNLIKKNGVLLNSCPTFPVDEARIAFGKVCVNEVKKYYPEVVEEVLGLADGNGASFDFLAAMIFTMYCYDTGTHCSCFAFKKSESAVFGRNSDFLVSIEKLYMNVLYKLDNAYSFNGNTTAFVEMEDGVNEYGLAVGLTFVPVKRVKAGFNVGILTRYLLEKCRSVDEAMNCIKKLPIASGGTLTIADAFGNMAVVELSADEIEIISPNDNFVCTANIFNSDKMRKYYLPDFDTWQAKERYDTMNAALSHNEHTVSFAEKLLSGKYGFMCQYNRKDNADTVWSVVYDLAGKKIYRVEGNPGRKAFKEDIRFTLI